MKSHFWQIASFAHFFFQRHCAHFPFDQSRFCASLWSLNVVGAKQKVPFILELKKVPLKHHNHILDNLKRN